ncbi:MAG: excalibur calcium-binding domain-containing protein [Rothia sp.]|uniref:excalibur calcium-binding domain-containing protein n=1 Tax=Rothia sp. (in: high G+C Gram-positive bacteria) TaxID=1885016 RepID=UPI001CAB5EAA|nr:excalibur calcium-binding domain-containing protein [Rothia sp. (in: high G+C Gram-positive bacteria)]MBF1675737.1 excalibur calcium-binding domain-containing protein [Rothia sp. (in: high G+C Gram-positive bacteria)]
MDIRNTITRFGATALIGCGLVVTAIPATFAQNDGETVTHEYQDRAASHISEVWYKGETLEISGEGFLTQDRASGSTIAIKLNKGAIKIDGKDYLEVTANDKGEFTVSIPWQSDLEDRVSVDVYLLSGSLKDNDTSRGGKAATVKIEARSVAPESPSASASVSASAEPSASPSATAEPSASASATAEPKKESKADSSASPSASATAADETVASVDAEVKNRADEKASASASVSPSATASASASTVVSPSASAEVKNEKKADQKVSTAKNDQKAEQKDGSQQAPAAQDQLGGSSSVQAPATEQPSPESTRFANCSEVAAAGLAPIPSSHPDFRKQFDADNNGLGCEVVDSGSSSNGGSSSSGSSSSQDNLGSSGSGAQDRLGSSSSSASLSSRAQRSSLANTGASNVFTVAGLGMVAVGLGVAGVTSVLRRKNS